MSSSLPDDGLFLGFDSSTQSLKATVLDSNLTITISEVVNFDSELPHYQTKDGVFRDLLRDGTIVSPTLMWVEALDLLLEKLRRSNLEFEKIVAISGSGQQHGSVYWKKGSLDLLTSLDPLKPLFSQLTDAFSTPNSPIWMDCSTTMQCRKIEEAVGGALELSRITGSKAYERFTGPQIRKLFECQPKVYHDTERISLVSSFMASVLIGGYASIDETDGAGMNLMDIRERTWSKLALQATAPGLEEKLGNLAPAYAVAGLLTPYFIKRYNFKKDCLVIQWSGDNPNSLAGLTLNSPGDIAISLGTSDNIFGIINEPQPSLEGHVFPNPVDPKCYMVVLCYKNGSLTREDVRNHCAERSWDVFNKKLEETPPLNDGHLGFYYKEHEILPPMPVGFHRYLLEDFNNNDDKIESLTAREVKEFNASTEIRAIIEGQILSIRGHAERLGIPVPPNKLMVTGGASSNSTILKYISLIFGCSVHTVQRPDSASLGAALRAAHGWLCNKEGCFVPIATLHNERLDKTSLSATVSIPSTPYTAAITTKYASLMKKRISIEDQLVKKFGRV